MAKYILSDYLDCICDYFKVDSNKTLSRKKLGELAWLVKEFDLNKEMFDLYLV